MILGLIVEPPFVQTDTRAAVSRGEIDTRVFQCALDLGAGLDLSSDRAIAAFHALYGSTVDTGPLAKLARGPAQECTRRADLVRSRHALNSIKLLQSYGEK